MAYPVSFQQLQTRVYQRLNMENQTYFATNTEVQDCINQGLARWYDEVTGVTFAGQNYRKSGQFQTVGNQSFYPFATTPVQFYQGSSPTTTGFMTDFYKLISVDVFFSTQQSVLRICARPYQEEDRNLAVFPLYSLGWIITNPVYYQQQGQAINFMPIPQSSISVGLNYMPVAPILVNPTDSIDSWNGWEEFIVLWAAKRLALKDRDQELMGLLDAELRDELDRIRMAASMKDESAEHIHDVTRNDNGGLWGDGSY